MSAPETHRRRPASRAVLSVLAALVPLVVIAVALSLSGSRDAARQSATADASHAVQAPAGQASTAHTSAASTSSPERTASRLELPGGSGALVVQLTRATDLRARPAGHVLARLSTKTRFGSPEVMWVKRRSGRWLGVVSPEAGNNRVGWITDSAVIFGRVAWELRVSLSARKLTVLDKGRIRQRYTVAVGAPGAPTPTGRFAVTDRLLTGDSAGPYGCCILALSATAPHAIQGWSGGNRIAIHSTPETSSIGEAASHGCIRLTLAEGRWLIGHVPLGTPTFITS